MLLLFTTLFLLEWSAFTGMPHSSVAFSSYILCSASPFLAASSITEQPSILCVRLHRLPQFTYFQMQFFKLSFYSSGTKNAYLLLF